MPAQNLRSRSNRIVNTILAERPERFSISTTAYSTTTRRKSEKTQV